MTQHFTKPQLAALAGGLDHGGAIYGRQGSRMGGAYRRCCERLVDSGLLDDRPPFAITIAGLEALREAWASRWARRGCMAYLDDLRRVEAALAAAQGGAQ